MERLNNLLIVAGAARNVGKTEFVCRLIEKKSQQSDIYALKVSAMLPDEAIYHGDHSNRQFTTNLFEETRRDLAKDTSRMLRAGAKKVYYLQGDDEQIRIGFQEFKGMIPSASPIVCESGSLWKYVQPGLLILVKAANVEFKPRALAIGEHASLIIDSNGQSGFPEIEEISLSKIDGWSLGSAATA